MKFLFCKKKFLPFFNTIVGKIMWDIHSPPPKIQWSLGSDWAMFVPNAANRSWAGPVALCNWKIIGLQREGGIIFTFYILSEIKRYWKIWVKRDLSRKFFLRLYWKTENNIFSLNKNFKVIQHVYSPKTLSRYIWGHFTHILVYLHTFCIRFLHF